MHKPAAYVKANDRQRRDANDICEEYSEELGEMSGRCLDIGSGTCDVVVDFLLPKLNQKASIVCSDISESMISFGKSKYGDNQRISFVKLNIESPDLHEDLMGQFHHVTSFYCIHWCQDMRQVFQNIFNILQPGGTTLLLFLTDSPLRKAYPVLAAMPRYQPFMKDVDRYVPVYSNSEQPRETIKTLIREVGFDIQHLSCREKCCIFETRALLSDFMMAVNPFIERMPADLGEEYKRDLIETVGKEKIIFDNNNSNDNEYSILFRYRVFVAYLKKPLSG